MNKLEKELEKELENAIQVEVPQPDLTRLNKFKPLLEQNKQTHITR